MKRKAPVSPLKTATQPQPLSQSFLYASPERWPEFYRRGFARPVPTTRGRTGS